MTHIIYLCIIASLVLYCIHLRKNQNPTLSQAIDDFNDALEDWELDNHLVPDGYKHDSELDAMVRETATTHYPTMAKSVKAYPNIDAPKKPAKKKPVKWCGITIPKGYKKHDGSGMPVKLTEKVSVILRYGQKHSFDFYPNASHYRWEWTEDDDDIIAYKTKKRPTMSKRKK